MRHVLVISIMVITFSLPLAAQAPHLRGQVDLRIGLVEGEEPYLFGKVRGLAQDASGRIFVADQRASEVRVFDPAGQHLFTVGRLGQGPGDLDYPVNIALDPAGRLWVVNAQSRYEVFTLDSNSARYLQTIRISLPAMAVRPMFDSLGGVIVAAVSEFPEPRFVHLRLDSAGREVERVLLPRTVSPDSLGQGLATIPRSNGSSIRVGVPLPFGPREVIARAPDGRFARVVTSRYVVELFDGHGQKVREIRRALEGPPVSPAERERAEREIDSTRTHYERFGGTYAHNAVPRIKPPFARIWYDRDGRLWAELSSSDGDETVSADVYSDGGRLLFTAEWPRGISLSLGSIRGEVGLGLERSEFGVERVVRLRFR